MIKRNCIKKFSFCLSIFLVLILFIGCDNVKHDNPEVLQDIAYDVDDSRGYTVYVMENSEYVPYLVLTNDYGGNCLLLRKYLLEKPVTYNDYEADKPSYYENCIIDTYLNYDFVNSIQSHVANRIVDTSLSITAKDSIGKCGDETAQILKKAFILSLNEVQLYGATVMLREGNELSYFENNERRVATSSDGVPLSWYLRTPDTWNSDVITYVDTDGTYESAGIRTIDGTSKYYIRPAFCLPCETKIEQKEVNDSLVYVINDTV